MPEKTDENVNMITEVDLDVCPGQQATLPLWHVIFYLCKRVVRSTIPKPCRFCSKDSLQKHGNLGKKASAFTPLNVVMSTELSLSKR